MKKELETSLRSAFLNAATSPFILALTAGAAASLVFSAPFLIFSVAFAGLITGTVLQGRRAAAIREENKIEIFRSALWELAGTPQDKQFLQAAHDGNVDEIRNGSVEGVSETLVWSAMWLGILGRQPKNYAVAQELSTNLVMRRTRECSPVLL